MANRINITDRDLDLGRGGFWIKDDGTPVPVRSYAEHIDTLRTLMGRDHAYYHDAYDQGWIRVSLYKDRDVSINFDLRHVTVPALRMVVSLLRHDRLKGRHPYEVELENEPYWLRRPDWNSQTDNGEPNPAKRIKSNDPDFVARRIMQFALDKNAAAKGLPAPPPPNMAEVGIAA